jgi:gamma-glutamylcyclotransferase (GGCT)/AIG2-like uncharacterized protein YtfP
MTAVLASGRPPPPRTDRLFAYGTLMAGFSRRPLLGDAVLEGRGRTRGSLYHFGEYPGVVLDDGGWVFGEVYRIADLADRLGPLDAAEWYDPADPDGSLYVRRAATVFRDGEPARLAWIYEYNQRFGAALARGPRVESGDWRAFVSAHRAAPR